MCIWGREAAGGNYAALSALTNIVSMIASAMFYEIFFTDSSRGTHLKIVDMVKDNLN